jgi:hypothetical protein
MTSRRDTALWKSVVFVGTLVLAAASISAFAQRASAAIVKPPVFEQLSAGDGDGSDAMTAMAVGPDGEVYTCGTVWHEDTGYDITVTCHADAPLGWTTTWDGGWGSIKGQIPQTATDIAVAPDGSVYVYGWSGGLEGEASLIKYTPGGTQLWVNSDVNPAWGSSGAGDMAIDARGYVYALWSQEDEEDGRPMVVLAKFRPDATLALSLRYRVAGYKTETYAHGLVVTPAGTIYVAGEAEGVDFTRKAFVVSWTAAGTRRWAKVYNGRGRADASFQAVTPCPDGGVYAAGFATSDARDLLLARYAANGDRTMTRRLGVADGHAQWATDIAGDGRGRIAVCGAWRRSDKGYYVALVRRDGSVVWEHDYSGDRTLGWAKKLAIDASGRVCVTGRSRGAWVDESYVVGPVATYAFSRAGTLRWSFRWPAGFVPSESEQGPWPNDIAVWQSSNVWVCGASNDRAGTGVDQFVIGWAL